MASNSINEEADRDESEGSEGAGPMSRRSAVGVAAAGMGALGGLATGFAIGGTAEASTTQLVVEVALRGDTFRAQLMPEIYGPSSGLDPSDLRGSPFWTEGWIYPEGTIKGSGFVPTEDGAIGHWFCRGNLITGPSRSEPHILSNQEFIFGLITDARVFPPDTLASVGPEAPNDPVHEAMRAITGGSGIYRGATGQVLEIDIGTNSTLQFGTDLTSPNFRFEFDLIIPDA